MNRHRNSLVLVLTALTLAATTLAAGPARATQATTAGQAEECPPDDPYGCLQTTTSSTLLAGVTTSCTASVASAQVGSRVDVTVTGAPAQSTVDLLLNGTVVDSEASGVSAATPGYADVRFSFVVPALAEGRYPLEAVGPAFQLTCLGPEGGFAVLGATASRDTGGQRSGGGSLARTGTTIGGLVLLALVLIFVGRRLQRRRTA